MAFSTPSLAGRDIVAPPPPDSAHAHDRLISWRPRSSLLKLRSVIYLALIDCGVIAGSFGAVALGRATGWDVNAWVLFGVAALPIYLLVAFNVQAFAAVNLQDPFQAIRRGLQALLLTIGAMILAVFYTRSSAAVPRLTIGLGSGLAIFLMTVARYLFVRHLTAIVGGNPFSAILIVEGKPPAGAHDFALTIAAESFFDPECDDPVMYDRLARSLATADRVVVACPPERRSAWTRVLRGAHVQGEIAVPELAKLSPIGLNGSSGLPSVIVAVGPLSLFDRLLKRLFDFSTAALGLLVLAPLFIVAAAAIKLDSRGPVLFRQIRVGRGNEMFSIYKFRSMRVGASDGYGHQSTLRGDDRLTRLGRFIRRTSIDELPQLFNVLLGNMSIVGPRPHALGSRAADKLFWEVDHRYRDRHAAKPGLTGLAQVRGFRGATHAEDDLRNRLQADLEYLENWSIWRDIKIVFLTLRVIFHRNAF